MIEALIMAGGAGTRLWPLSRASHPKQFLALNGENTLLQSTVDRLDGLDIGAITTICNEEHRFFVAEQLRGVNQPSSIILEPVGRNTAPAIALAAFTSKEDSLLLVLAADHSIQNDADFTKTIMAAIPLAESGKLVTFGIVPSEAHTGYGYIKTGKRMDAGFAVSKFVEKPSKTVAKDYLASGEYYWNSGMFLFKVGCYLEELKKFRPDIYKVCQSAVAKAQVDLDFLRIDKEEFKSCPSESIDYAVMEKTTDAVVIPMNAGWSDLGSWNSLWEIEEKDKRGNVSHGDVILNNCNNTYVRTDGKLTVTIGVNDLIVVSTKDAVMVASKDSVENIKEITEELKHDSRPEWEIHRDVYRPWGKYDSIGSGNRYQVKLITVKPGAKLSVQMHHHRAEHWVVVSGIAKVTKGEDTFLLSENESIYVPLGVVHALENPGKTDLELIEVQSGGYLGEDDIVRFDDRYGRNK